MFATTGRSVRVAPLRIALALLASFCLLLSSMALALPVLAGLDTGSLVVYKTDDGDPGQLLAGAEFTIEAEGMPPEPLEETDTPGIFCMDGLQFGVEYTVTETKPPFGYRIPGADSQTFNIPDSESTCDDAERLDTPDLTFVNEPRPGAVVVYKTDAVTDELVDGAVFTIESEGETPQAMDEVEDGIFCTSFLSFGIEYTVTEVAPPDGYQLADPDSQTVSLDDDSPSDCEDAEGDDYPADLTFENKLIDEDTGAVVVHKTDVETEELVEGAVFTITPNEEPDKEPEIGEPAAAGDGTFEGGEDSDTLEEVEAGIHCIEGLSFGEYTVTETTPPPGYEPADPDNQSITINSDSLANCNEAEAEDPDLIFENQASESEPAGIQVVKDDQDGDPLEGATFKLYLDDGNGVFDPVGGSGCATAPTAGGADAIAAAIVADPSTLDSAAFDAVPAGTPNGTAGCLSWFATHGNTFGILTSGDVNLADDPNASEGDGADLDGDSVRGNSDFDVSVLKIDLTTPAGANCLSFDFAFYSEEFPEYVGSPYNDAFIAELNTSNWTTSGSSISAPNNFAFDPDGNVISINSTGFATDVMNEANAAGTTYDGGTVLLSAATPVNAGPNSLYLSIFDQGDGILDSAVFLDNIRFTQVADLGTECVPGATEAPPGGDVVIDTQTTDAEGLATFTDLEPGTYWLQESAAPEGCELSAAMAKVTLTKEDVAEGTTIQIPLENDCSEQDVGGGNPTPTPGQVPDTAAGFLAAGWLPILMAVLLLGSIGAFATVNVQSNRSRRRR